MFKLIAYHLNVTQDTLTPVFGSKIYYGNSVKAIATQVNDGFALTRAASYDEIVHNSEMPSYPEVYTYDAEGYGDVSYIAICKRRCRIA
jgi:hypothetical protein